MPLDIRPFRQLIVFLSATTLCDNRPTYLLDMKKTILQSWDIVVPPFLYREAGFMNSRTVKLFNLKTDH